MKTVLVKVTQEDIDNGVICSGGLCPIALASAREFGLNTEVNKVRCRVFRKGRFVVDDYDLPRSARRFITRFDKGKIVKPFNFKLKVQ